MRELTKRERYQIDGTDREWFVYDHDDYCCCAGPMSEDAAISLQIDLNNKHKEEITKLKPSDIKKHVFSDHIVSGCHLSNDLCVVFREKSFGFNIKKQDAIAIAKALGVTGEDL